MASLDPMEHAKGLIEKVMETATIRSILKFNVLQALPVNGTTSIQDLSKSTNVQASLLERLLRLAAGEGFLLQTNQNEFGHTAISKAYLTPIGDFFSMSYDESMSPMFKFPEYIDARSVREEPSSPTHNPYSWAWGQEGKTSFEVVAAQPERLQAFQRGLGALARGDPITGFYDFDKLDTPEDRAILIDVGGGHGQFIGSIVAAHTKLDPSKMILQDRPETIEIARKREFLPAQVKTVAHDFFTEQPVKAARAYCLRKVTHDWSDEDVVKILKNLAGAMAKDSKLLLVDVLVPTRVDTHEGRTAAWMDIALMPVGGKERTKEMFEDVLDKAGLQLDKIYPAPHSEQAIVEASLKGR